MDWNIKTGGQFVFCQDMVSGKDGLTLLWKSEMMFVMEGFTRDRDGQFRGIVFEG